MKPESTPAKRILVAPLDWGLGHATRCIPIIKWLLQRGCAVQIASSGGALILLKQEFPTLRFHELVSYDVHYSDSIPLSWSLLFQVPKFLQRIKAEHKQIERIVRENNIEVILSDNRYGCWSNQSESVFITHQVNILLPERLKWAEAWLNGFNRRAIKKFSRCWVPDSISNRVTGELSGAHGLDVTYIGMLSRFERIVGAEKKYDVLILLSGPEPQRSVMERALVAQLKNYSGKVMMVRGLPGETGTLANLPAHVSCRNHVVASELNTLIEASKLVVARSGYSTVMDLARLGAKAVLLPTPGQTEQEYLARQLMERKIAYCTGLDNFDLHSAIGLSSGYNGFDVKWDDSLLNAALNEIVQ